MKTLFLIIFLSVTLNNSYGKFSLDVSGGIAAQSYNKVQIPGKLGTGFDLYKDFDIQGPVFYYSLKLGYNFNEKNHIFLLYAPLSANYTGLAPFDIKYQNTTFLKGNDIDAYYQFNSYRLTYRRDIYESEKWLIGIGFTAKIRDAEIKLTDSFGSDNKEDFGFVPLLNFYAEYNFNNWAVFLDGDGLAGSQGRAFDVYLGGKRPINEFLKIKAAYRMVEGGADVSTVYNFTMLHFANFGLIINI